MPPHRDKQNSKYLKLTSEMHTITVCFVCKSCRCSFSQVTDLISHKIESHFDEFRKIKSIVFEESNNVVSDEDAYDVDPDGNLNAEYKYTTYDDGMTELSLPTTTTEADISIGPEVQIFEIEVSANSCDDVSSPIPLPVSPSLDVSVVPENKDTDDSCNATSPVKLANASPSPLLPSSSSNEANVPDPVPKADCVTNANKKISTAVKSVWNPFVLLERLPLQLDTSAKEGSPGYNADDADWDYNQSPGPRDDDFSDSELTSYGCYPRSNKKRKLMRNEGRKVSRSIRGNYYSFPTQLQNTDTDTDTDVTLTLAEWLKKEAEANPQNIIRLQPDPTTIVNCDPLKNPRSISIICKLCWTKLTSVKALKIHVQNCWLHNKKKHCFCLPCDKKFTSAWDLNKHTSRRHNQTNEEREARRRFKCNVCRRGFFDNFQLKSHFKTVHIMGKEKEKRSTQVEQGERKGKERIQTDRERKEKISAAHHMTVFGKKVQTPLNYLQPLFVFPTTEEEDESNTNASNLSLVDWLKKEVENDSEKQNVILLEPDPLIKINHPEDAAIAMGPISSSNPITCKLCSRKLTSELEVRIHVKHCWLRNKQRHVYCVPCDKKLNRPTYLRTHNVVVHLPPEEKQSLMVKFVCEFCSKGYFSEPDLRRHLETHKSKEEQYLHRPFICEICGFSFHFFAALRNHLVIHTDVKEFKCEHPGCTKSFKQRHNLIIHQRAHLNLKPFKCTQEGCGKAFNYAQNLKNHAWSHVEGGRPRVYECSYPGCDKKYGKSFYVKRHVAMTHHIQPKTNS